MPFKDEDEFLDRLWDHIFPTEEDEDPEFFDHLTKFFDQAKETGGSSGGTNSPHAPRRRRTSNPSNANTTSRRRSRSSSGYGSSAWFGTGN